MTPQYDPDFLLEDAISPDSYKRIARAATAKWAGGPHTSPSREVDDVVWRRHDNTVRFIIPWIQEHIPLSDRKVLDIGCGCGSSSLAMSHFAREVVGLEIDSPSVEAFRVRMKTFGIGNAQIIETDPEGVLDNCLELIDNNSIVLLLAVVEHLTPDEQLVYLSSIWDALAPGQLLIVAETPNFLALQDRHTFDRPFAHMTQGQQFERWLRASPPDLRFREHLLSIADSQGTEALLTERFRLGVGVSPQVFQLAIPEDLNEVTVADGFSQPIVDWFPVTPDDRRLVEEFGDLGLGLPIGFARSVLSFIFQKPANRADAEEARTWNEARRLSIPDLIPRPDFGFTAAGASPDLTSRLLVERERELSVVYSSRSWKITRPLRVLSNIVRGWRSR